MQLSNKIPSFVRKCSFWLLWAVNVLLSIWCLGAIHYLRVLSSSLMRMSLLAIFLAGMLCIQIMSIRRQIWIAAGTFLPVAIIISWLTMLHPTGKQDWDPPFAVLAKSHFTENENVVTIENIRDFHYRTEDDYDIRYRTETYRLDEVVSMDFSITHWNQAPLYGHIILSFLFKDGRRLAISPEARMRRGEKYEILPGFYRCFELIFIVAKEEDVFQLRTHHRKYEHSEVLLYPTTFSPENAAFILKDLLKRTNDLPAHPEYYNGVLYNCLSCMGPTAEKIGFRYFSTRYGICNGIVDEIGYREGWLLRDKANEPFQTYQKRHSVNQYVEHLVDSPDFSQKLRSY